MSRITSAAGVSLAATRDRALDRVRDYIELTKPRIVMLELVTIVVASHLASPAGIAASVLLNAVMGAAFVAASAGAFNQWWEQSTDALMTRTAVRPLPAGRLTSRQVIVFGVLTLVVGSLELALTVSLVTAALALATWLIYVLAYTPLKTRSPFNTTVGAVSGALPILIGWTATGAAVDMRALALVGVMFLWQFPHFMAIAWLYRGEYVRAGQRMLTVVEPTGVRAGAQAVTGALALIPVSLVPAITPWAGSPTIYIFWTLVLGAMQLVAAVMFLVRRNDSAARRLLRASLLYLVCWMGLLLMVAV
ncbi:MAG TPA: heme o synthase [Lacipirellulaceae bacterium]|jgi:protoheme IX farnesyltransferase|nr:heme o synthase [Lacipirellulaceae bacterium]